MSIVITGCGVIASLGIGKRAFFTKMLQQAETAAKVVPNKNYRISQFDIAAVLGKKKGTRVLDRTAALAVGATALAQEDTFPLTETYSELDLGLVLGTLNGSIQRIVAFLQDTYRNEECWVVSPEEFPNTVMNFSAGQCAIWQQLRAVNTTIAGGSLAGLLSVRYASRMLQFNQAGAIFAGGVEEYSEVMANCVKSIMGIAAEELGEGSAMFLLEQQAKALARGATIYAEILASEIDFIGHSDPQTIINRCLEKTFAKAHITPQRLWAVIESGISTRHKLEQQCIDTLLQGHRPFYRLVLTDHLGHCSSATSALQIATLLALFSNSAHQTTTEKLGLILCVGHSGTVGCCLLRSGN